MGLSGPPGCFSFLEATRPRVHPLPRRVRRAREAPQPNQPLRAAGDGGAPNPYLHLTLDDRERLLDLGLGVVSAAGRRVVLFAEAIDKGRLLEGGDPIDQAFTQVVTRFNHFLRRKRTPVWGILAVDHDQHKANRLANLLRGFQREGARWGAAFAITPCRDALA